MFLALFADDPNVIGVVTFGDIELFVPAVQQAALCSSALHIIKDNSSCSGSVCI